MGIKVLLLGSSVEDVVRGIEGISDAVAADSSFQLELSKEELVSIGRICPRALESLARLQPHLAALAREASLECD